MPTEVAGTTQEADETNRAGLGWGHNWQVLGEGPPRIAGESLGAGAATPG